MPGVYVGQCVAHGKLRQPPVARRDGERERGHARPARRNLEHVPDPKPALVEQPRDEDRIVMLRRVGAQSARDPGTVARVAVEHRAELLPVFRGLSRVPPWVTARDVRVNGDRPLGKPPLPGEVGSRVVRAKHRAHKGQLAPRGAGGDQARRPPGRERVRHPALPKGRSQPARAQAPTLHPRRRGSSSAARASGPRVTRRWASMARATGKSRRAARRCASEARSTTEA